MRFLFLSLVLFFLLPTIKAQSILLNANLGYSNHIANVDFDKPQVSKTIADIGSYYSDSPILGLQAMYLFNDLRYSSSSIFAGILFEHSQLSSDIPKLVLGDDLSINSIGFSVGYKRGLTENNPFGFFTMSIEYLSSFYNGTITFPSNFSSESTYNRESSLRAVVGFEYLTSMETPFMIGVTASFGYGTVRRGEIKFYEGENYLESLNPTGDLVLPDYVFNVLLNVSYLIGF
jgi:hypothetical protein